METSLLPNVFVDTLPCLGYLLRVFIRAQALRCAGLDWVGVKPY